MDIKTLIQQLERRLAYERMVAAVSEVLLTGTDRDLALNQVCRLLGEATGVSRCYIFENFDGSTRTCNTVEWVAPGIEAVKDGLQDVSYDGIRYWKISLENGELIRADDIRTLPPDVVDILSWQGISSILVVPLSIVDRWHGFLGFDVCGSPRNWDDDDVSVLVTVARLVSAYMEREVLRHQLARTSRLSAVGSLAGGIGHEFNNIHAGIRGLVELALEDRRLPAQTTEDLTRVLALVDRGVDLTHRLIGLSKQRTHGQPVNLRLLIADVAVLLQRTFTVERIDFQYATTLESAWVLASPADLGHVLLTLLQNAIEALHDAPEKKISVDLQQPTPSRFVISVCDSGPGIPESMLDSVFEPFFTTKGKLGGGSADNPGLGLSVALSIVSELGGRLSVTNQPHHGAAFTLELPASSFVRRLHPEAAAFPPRTRKARIGLLDDEQRIIDLLERFLRRDGHHVESFSLVRDACEALSSRRYDVFLLDLTLRDGTGRQLLEKIEGLPRKLRPRTIVMSGQDESSARSELGGVPFDAFVAKPFPSLVELGKLVVDLIASRG